MKGIDKLQEEEKIKGAKGNLESYLYKVKLRKNIPYAKRDFENNFLNSTDLKQSYERKKKNIILIPPYSSDCYFSFDEMEPEIKEKVQNSDFWIYAKEVVLSKGYLFMKGDKAEKRLTFSSDLMRPLIFLDGEIKGVGLKIFRIIKKICINRDRKYLPPRKIRKLIEILLNNPDEIKDECFFQLIKQIRNNPFLVRNFNEWKLLAIVASFVSPSETFIYFFINFMIEVYYKTKNDEIKQWVKYVVKRILKTEQKSERFVLPCFEELRSIEERRKIHIEVFYCNGSSEYFFFESYSTVSELKDEIIEKYGFDAERKNYYGIYEYCCKAKTIEENFIDDKIKILDIIGSWSNEIDFLKAKNQTENIQVTYRLYFKIKFYFSYHLLQDKVLFYYQCFN